MAKRLIQLTCHILNLPETQPAKIAINWIPHATNRLMGRPKKTWQEIIRGDLKRIRTRLYQTAKTTQDWLK